ncbi:lysylphosphatidylglycerol synthase transmembrane domain-containing protein [Frankia sp. R43]|uniref:lysylphosphatidylglycerol synthase transmembrane domain-containing protein n=1 Tax=Frankia sp. R43 TaxID=269536 RepID=UPI0009FB4B43|nr:lysylphosphatidylglycerol synthase transmembrane domain-containing protein [Frankia sp. R43]
MGLVGPQRDADVTGSSPPNSSQSTQTSRVPRDKAAVPANRAAGAGATAWTRRLRLAGTALVVIAAVVMLSRQARYLPKSPSVLATADGRWVLAAGGLSVLSVLAFAGQQLVLLRALGAQLSARRALMVTYAQTAITMIVPGGSAAGTAYTLSNLRAAGITVDAALGALTLSGIASLLGLCGLYAVGAVLFGAAWPPGAPQVAAVLVVMALICCLPVAVRSLPERAFRRRRQAANPTRRLRTSALVACRWRWGRFWMRRAREVGRAIVVATRSLRERDWFVAVGLAGLNWATDALALAAAARATGADTDPQTLGLAYLAVQVGRYVSPLPGGLGIVEPTLALLLSSAGASVTDASATTLIYRAFSYWHIAAVGLPLGLWMNGRITHGSQPSESTTAVATMTSASLATVKPPEPASISPLPPAP